MSVIGRLDEQVDAVLIAPLDRNRQPTRDAREHPTGEQAKPPQPNPPTPDEDESLQGERAIKEDLPVWLL